MNKNGMGSHHSTKMINDEWLTPPSILKELGEFDLDPCSPIHRPWPTALNHFTKENCGLSQEWFGRIWMNPPYGINTGKWLAKLAEHNNGIALIFARTETKMFFDHVWYKADALLFIKGRLFFHDVKGNASKTNAGAPSVLIAYGKNNIDCLKKVSGKFLILK